ncbi:ParA family protein [Undibacterium sp. Di26W]
MIAVVSMKGGVGKTSVTANLAAVMHRMPNPAASLH